MIEYLIPLLFFTNTLLLFLLIPQIIAINIGLGEDYLLSDIVILLNILYIYRFKDKLLFWGCERD